MGLLNKKQNPRRLQVVAHRGILPNYLKGGSGDSNFTLSEARYMVKVGSQRCADLRLAFTGYRVQAGGLGEITLDYDLLCRASIETPDPLINPRLRYRDDLEFLVKKDVAEVLTDSIGLSAEAHAQLFVSVSSYVNSSETYPVANLSGAQQFASTLAASASQVGVATGSFVSTSRTAAMAYCATAVLGIPEKPFPAVAIIGDSIANGDGDSVQDNNGNYGWIAKGLWNVGADNHVVPYTKLTMGGDGVQAYSQGKGFRRLGMLRYVSHAISNLGTNDLANGLEITQTRMLSTWRQLKARGLHVTQGLIMPRVTSSNQYIDSAGQDYVSAHFAPGGTRDQLNAWIPTQVGGGLLDAVINPNPYVEVDWDNLSSPNHGKWITTGTINYPTADGVHPSTAINVLAAIPVNQWATALPAVLY